MKKWIKAFGILLLPLLVVAGYAVPQIAFAGGGSFDAQTVLNFIEYTPDIPTPTPTPVDPTIIPTGTAQTGDFMLACIGIFAIAAAVSVAIFLRKMISYNTKSLLAVFCMSMAPLVLAGSCVVGVSNATAARDGALVSPKIDVYVNTQGGPVHYGEGTTSNVQTYTNTTGDMIYINEIQFKVTSENSNVFVGQWTGTLDDGTTIFKGGAGDVYKLSTPIFLNNGESFEVTWETETQSEDLMDCIGTAPVSICYMTFEAKYTVDFDSNGGSAVPSQTVIYQQKVTEPSDPSYPKNSFVYWASDEELTNEYDFDTPVTQDMTLYAKWVVDPEYVEEVEEEAAEDAEQAKDDVMDALRGILTEEELELIGDDIDELLADFKADLEKATTPEEVDQAKKDFEEALLNIEKGALKDGSDKQEKAAEDAIDDVPGLSTSDISRYKKQLKDKKNETDSKIDAASNFENAKKEQQKFEPSAEDLIDEATELGETKNEARDTSEEVTEAAEKKVDAFQDISESTKTKYKAKLEKIKEDTDKGIDDAESSDDVADVLDDQNGDIADIIAEIEEIIETREAIKTEGKQLMSDKNQEISELGKVRGDLKEIAIKNVTDLYTAFEKSMDATDDIDSMNKQKKEFEEHVKKIVDDITAIDTAISEGQAELNSLAKSEDEKISLRTDINANDKKELQAGIADLNEKGKDAIAESGSVQEATDRTATFKQQINTYVANIVVVNLVVSDTTAAHFEDPNYPKVPITTKASQKSTADAVSLDIVITGQKKRVSSVVDDKGGTYQVNEGAISVVFTGNFSTITATIEDIPDEPYAYLNDANDTLTFVYDEHRSEKTTTTFDVLDTSAGVPWTQQMSSASATIQKVVFETSFNTEEAAPASTANWFKQNDTEATRPLLKIEGLQNLDTSKVVSANSMFKNVMASQIDGMENWDLSLCTDFSYMFEGCAKLVQTPDFSKWKVYAGKSFSSMFCGCISLPVCPDMSSWESRSYTVYLNAIFKDCRSIKDFSNINKLKTNSVSSVRDMFYGCSGMEKTPDLSEWNFGESVDMIQMFNNCSSLSDASSLKDWKFKNVSNMYYAFHGNTSLKTLDISTWTSSGSNVNYRSAFSGCTSLEELDISLLHFASTSLTGEDRTSNGMFSGCSNLKKILTDEYGSGVLTKDNSANMFYNCKNLPHFDDKEIDFNNAFPSNGERGYFTPKHPNITLTFADGSTGHFVDLEGNTITSYMKKDSDGTVKVMPIADKEGEIIKSVVDNNLPTPNTYDIVDGYITLKWDANFTIKATTGPETEAYALLTSSTNGTDDVLKFVCDGNRDDYDADHTFDVEDVVDKPGWYEAMAGSSPTITSVIIDQSFQKARPKHLDWWFAQNVREPLAILNSINGLDNINTSETVTFKYTFVDCSYLTDLDDLTSWKINENADGTSFERMFYGCFNIQSFPGFSPESNIKVSSTNCMFWSCINLKSADINMLNFNASSNSRNMFDYCEKLENVFCDKDLRSTIARTSSNSMFDGCVKLPNYNEYVTDSRAAYPNDGVGGYFTADPASVTLGDFAGKYYAEDGSTELGPTISGALGTTMKVKPVASESGKVAKGAIDNAETLYTLDANGCFTVTFDANYTITAQVGSADPEAYAALTSSENGENDTLEFWYDENRWMYKDTYDIIDAEYPGWREPMMGDNPTIAKVKIDSSFSNARPKRTSNWFAQNADSSKCKLNEISGLNNINTSEVLSMSSMFSRLNLSSIDGIGGWNVSKVSSFKNMFYSCANLSSLPDLSSWRLNEANSISYMFGSCSNLTNTSWMSSWEANKVQDISYVFCRCFKLANPPDLSKWNLKNVGSAECLFDSCRELTSIPNVEKWEFENLWVCRQMFSQCPKLTQNFDLSAWKFSTTNNLSFSFMFYGSSKITQINISGFPFSSTTSAEEMFTNCSALTNIYCDSDARVVPSAKSEAMFHGCSKLHNFDGTKATDSTFAFPDTGTEGYFTSKHPTIQLTGLGTDGHFENASKETITEITGDLGTSTDVFAFVTTPGKSIAKLEDNTGTPYELDNTKFTVKFDYSYTITATLSSDQPYALLTSNTNGDDVLKFVCDGNRGDYDADHTFDVENVVGKPGWSEYIAGNDATITSVVIDESFKNAKPKRLEYWFEQNYNPSLRKLTSISGLQNINTTETTAFSYTFYHCTCLTSLEDLSEWTIGGESSYGVNFSGMFEGCSNIESFPGFNIESQISALSTRDMFSGCSNLKSVDINMINYNSSSNISGMFENCGELENIFYEKDLRSTISETSSTWMFDGCNNLPNFDAAVTNVQAAFPSNGKTGYFTSKNPTVTLTGLSRPDAIFEDPITENEITSASGPLGTTVDVKIDVLDEEKMVDAITDNVGTVYDYNATSKTFTIKLDACYTITATLEPKHSPKAVYDTNEKTFTLYDDNQSHAGLNVIVYDVVNTPWDMASKTQGVLAPWCKVDTDYDVSYPIVDDSIVTPTKIIINESFKGCTKDANHKPFYSMAFWFAGMRHVKSVEGLENVPSNVTDMTGLFSRYTWKSGEGVVVDSTLDLTNLDTSKVTSASSMLAGTWFDKVIVPDGFLSNLTVVGGFVKAQDGETIKEVRGLGIFSEMKTFTLEINGKIFADGITNADFLFYSCRQLTELSVTPDVMDLSSLTSAQYMFGYMTSVELLDLSGHASMPIQKATQMFVGDEKLKTIKLNNDISATIIYTQEQKTLQMFTGCTLLVGGDGFKCTGEPKNDDYIYAKPGKKGSDGYFTYSGDDQAVLSYDLDDQDCDPAHNADYYMYSQIVKQNESFTAQGATALPTPQCTDGSGREFKNWVLEGDPSETPIHSGDAVLANTSEVTLVAVWWIPPPTAKAVYTESDKTLTFYYDTSSHSEATYVFTNLTSGSPFLSIMSKLETITFNESFKEYKEITNTSSWFSGFTKLSTINHIENFDTSTITNMMMMFKATSIKNLDLSGNVLTSLNNAYGMAGFCTECQLLESVKFPEEISAEANCNYFFKNCPKLTTVYGGKLKFSSGGNDPAFGGCSSLVEVHTSNGWYPSLSALLGETQESGYSNWTDKNSAVKSSHDIRGNAAGDVYTRVVPKEAKAVFKDGTLTFYYDSETHSGDVYEVPTETVSVSPFSDVEGTTTKVVFTEGFYDFQSITDLRYWFQDFTNLTEVVGINYLYTNNVISMMDTFYNTNITSMDLSNNVLNNLTSKNALNRAFSYCRSLKSLKFPEMDINELSSVKELAYGCSALEVISFGHLKCANGDSDFGALGGCTSLKQVSANNSWTPYLSGMLQEAEGSYSNWTNSAGDTLNSHQISGSTTGDTYTKVEEDANNSSPLLDSLNDNMFNSAFDALFDLLAVIFKVVV